MNSACPQIVRPAELLRGITFAADFTDRLSMIKDEWTLTNNPDVYNGVTLDGVNQCVSIKVTNPMTTYVSSMTWHMEFVPNFTPGTGTNYLWDTVGSRYLVYITAAGDLVVSLSGTVIFAVAWASYSAYWNASSRNVLTLTASSGDNDIYLNGNLLSNNAAAWTPGIATSLTLGARFCCTTGYTAIKILSFKMGAYLATLQEHIDIYNNQTWNYMNKADVILQMRHDDYDITNVRTLDSSGNANHAQLGDGSTPATYPTQNDGYMNFAGGTKHAIQSSSPISDSTSPFTVLMTVKWDAWAAPGGRLFELSGIVSVYAVNGIIYYYDGNTATSNAQSVSLGPIYTVAIQRISTTVGRIWVNGINVTNASVINVTATTAPWIWGNRTALNRGFVGDIYDARIFANEVITPTKILDYHHRVMSTVARQV